MKSLLLAVLVATATVPRPHHETPAEARIHLKCSLRGIAPKDCGPWVDFIK